MGQEFQSVCKDKAGFRDFHYRELTPPVNKDF